MKFAANSHEMRDEAMVRTQDIQSLTDFQRKAKETIARLKKTGRPAVLTVNGHAEVVVQDAASYQRLLDRVEEADRLAELRESIAEFRAGRVRDMADAVDELEHKHLSGARRRARREISCRYDALS
jgi:prevent-host-death family protein